MAVAGGCSSARTLAPARKASTCFLLGGAGGRPYFLFAAVAPFTRSAALAGSRSYSASPFSRATRRGGARSTPCRRRYWRIPGTLRLSPGWNVLSTSRASRGLRSFQYSWIWRSVSGRAIVMRAARAGAQAGLFASQSAGGRTRRGRRRCCPGTSDRPATSIGPSRSRSGRPGGFRGEHRVTALCLEPALVSGNYRHECNREHRNRENLRYVSRYGERRGTWAHCSATIAS